MLKHIPIFWKLSAAVMIVILIVLFVDYSLEGLNDEKSQGFLRTFLTAVIAIILSCGLAWFIVNLYIKRCVRRLTEGMNALAEKKFNFRLDENNKDEISTVYSSFNNVAEMFLSFHTELEKNRDYTEGIVESTSDIIITVNPNKEILTFNTGAEKALGYQRFEVIGKSIEMLWADPRERDAAIDRLKYGDNVVNIETRFLTKSGEVRDVLLTFSLMRNQKGDMIGTFGISKDITEEKRLQNKLMQSQRLVAIGEIFTGIQHSLKNMLNALKGGAYMVKTGLAKDERTMLEEGWGIVQQGIDRMTNMSRDMLKYVKERTPKLEMVDLTQVLSEIKQVINKSASDNSIVLLLNISPKLPSVQCDVQMIHTAVMDVVSNALDACVWKEYSKEEIPKVVINAYSNYSEQNIIIDVKDNGCGMTENVKNNIFTPFFSTKSKTGTGLGMSVASRMINSHNGRINVESELNKGTLFQIVLPIDVNKRSKENYNGKKSSGS
ncbi:PAS domain-containing sensor histidine kinase [Bacteroidota bacterium]